MKTSKSVSDVVNEVVIAEAAAWLTRLQNTDKDTDKAAFKQWLAASPANARAFARVNDVWELIPGAVARDHYPRVAAKPRIRAHRTQWWVAAACAAMLLLVVGAAPVFSPAHDDAYQTVAGEQKTVTLADDTRITLSTDTRIVVAYREHQRHVTLEHGEAIFRVTHNPSRPFVLSAGNQQIVDLGTVFDVSHYAQAVTVTLLEGKVWVHPLAAVAGHSSPSMVLDPGERLTIGAVGKVVVDRPLVQDVTSWQQGRLYFSDVSLAEALAKIDRYGGVSVRLADPALGSLRISGVFSTRDPREFAAAVARLHGLRVEAGSNGLILTR